MESEAGKAAAILNLYRPVTLAEGALELQMRRLTMSEVFQHIERLGAAWSNAMANVPRDTKISAAIPAIFQAVGSPSLEILAGVTQHHNGNGEWSNSSSDYIGSMDVEHFAEILLVFAEMHEKAIATFQKALAKFEREKPKRESNAPSIASSVQAIPSTP